MYYSFLLAMYMQVNMHYNAFLGFLVYHYHSYQPAVNYYFWLVDLHYKAALVGLLVVL